MKQGKNKGFSFIEILISLSLITVATAALATVFETFFRGNALAESRSKELELIHNLQLQLFDQTTCDTNFKNKVLSQNGILLLSKITDKNNAILYSNNSLIADGKLQVASINLEVASSDWSAYTAAKGGLPPEGYLLKTSLKLSLNRKGSVLGSKVSAPAFDLPLYLDATGMILSCYTAESDLNALTLATTCAQLGGTFDAGTVTCKFSPDCNALNPNRAVDGVCVINKINSLKQDIASLKNDVDKLNSASTGTFQSKMQSCLNHPTTVNVGKDSITCSAGLGLGYTFTATTTSFTSNEGLVGNRRTINTPGDAQYLYDVSKTFLTIALPQISK
jgi:prepilin-type N-terminal cleavage/methylation domain-containing protein